MKKYLLSVFYLFTIALSAQPLQWRYVNANITVFAERPSEAGTVFTGDAAGLIKMSTNYGSDWSMVYRGDASYISDIEFIDKDHGFATTATAGLLLVTTDGGQSWSQKMMIDSADNIIPERFYSIEIIDATTLIINPDRYEGSRGLISTDKGMEFEEIHIPGTAFHVSGDTLISFGKIGFGFGIYRSTDLGKSWPVSYSPSGLSRNNFLYNGFGEVDIINANTFSLTGNGNNPEGVFITKDGGQSFSMMVDPVNNFYPEYTDFEDAQSGIIAGRISSAGYGFFTTSDGGQTWTQGYNADSYGTQLKPPFKRLSNNSIIGQKFQHTVISTDEGVTFTDHSDDFNPSGTISHEEIQIVDNDHLYAQLRMGTGFETSRVRYSNDGGMTWHLLKDSTGASLNQNLHHMQAISKDTVLYLQNNSIRRYIKNGNGSGRILYSQTGFGSTLANMIRNGNKLLAFTNGKIYYSTNRGMNWDVVGGGANLNTSSNKDIQFTDFDNIYALQDDRILKSNDTGRTWIDVTNGINLTTSGTNGTAGFIVKSENEVIIFGYSGRLYRTTDGGQTWTDLKPGLPDTPVNLAYYDFRFMEFQTDMIGYAGDRNPNGGYYILQTTDGGINWSVYNKGQSMVVPIDMHFADSSTAVLMGGAGPNVIRYFGDTYFATDTLSVGAPSGGGSFISENRMYNLNIYPNPGHDKVYVEGLADDSFRCVHISGQAVQVAMEYSRGRWVLDIQNLKKGIYLIYSENGVHHGKLIVE